MGDGCTTILEAPIGTADGELLERYVVQREPQAFQALVRRHQPRVLRVCRRLLGDEHVAEDVCQETFVVLARKAAELPWQRSIGPWLNAVARRLALNARTRARRRQHDPLDEDVVSAEAGPTARAEHRELEAALGSELGQLPDKYREPIVLCYLEGKTNVEAARELGWPTGSIARRLDRARSLLLERLTARGLATWLMLALLALGLGWWNSSPTASKQERRPRLAKLCRPEVGPEVLAMLEMLTGERSSAVSRQTVATQAQAIAEDAAKLPDAGLGEAARELAEEADKPGGVMIVPAARVLLFCANCHAANR